MKESDQAPAGAQGFPWRYGLIAIALLLAAFSVSQYLLSNPPKADRQKPARHARFVETTSVTPGEHVVVLSATGEVRPAEQLQLSARITGVVESIDARFVPGRLVSKGAPLLRIDDADYRVALDSAEANLSSALAALAQEKGRQAVARADFELLGTDVSEVETSLMLRAPQLQAAQAEVQSARAAVERARLDLSRTRILAPFDALVLSREIGVGAVVNGPATELASLAKANPYWVELLVPVENLRWVDVADENGPGSRVEIRDTSQPKDGPWSGRIIELLDSVESSGRRARLLAEIDPISQQTGERLLLGSYVGARIQGRSVSQAYALEPGWIHDGGVRVFRGGVLQIVDIEVLHRARDQVIARIELQPGDAIITTQLGSVVAGMRVRTEPVADAAQPMGERAPVRTPEQAP